MMCVIYTLFCHVLISKCSIIFVDDNDDDDGGA